MTATTVPGYSDRNRSSQATDLRVQVIGRFIEQQHVRVGQQQFAQRHAPAFAAGEPVDVRVPGRQAQGFRRDFQFAFQVMAVTGLQDVFQARLFGGQGVEIGIRFRIGGVDRVEFLLRPGDGGQCLLDIATHVFSGIQRRFLGQETDVEPGLRRAPHPRFRYPPRP